MSTLATTHQDRLIPVDSPSVKEPSGHVARDLKPNAATATSSGRENTLRPEDAPIHDWYRFVLSYPPHLVRRYVDRFDINGDQIVLDPFCGTGTTLVEAMKLGVPSIGFEAIPMVAFAARTKTDWTCDPSWLEVHAQHVAETALGNLAADGIVDEPINTEPVAGELRGIPEGLGELIFKNAISPLPLHKWLVLREAMMELDSAEVTGHQRLALATTLVQSASNLRFGPEVGVGKIKSDAAVIGPWLRRVGKMASDLRTVTQPNAPATVIHDDARSACEDLLPKSIDAVITSPPYPNEKDYTRTVRLESVLLGFTTTKSQLRNVKQEMLRSNTRGVFASDDDARYVQDIDEVQQLADCIDQRRVELQKTSGFERRYANVVREYFGGMRRHLRSLRGALKPGAKLAYVVGDQASYFRVLIKTGALLELIAATEGFDVVGRDLFRTRFSTATRSHLREEVLLLRWAG